MKLSFACLGNRYGWGGMLESMDCSMLTRNVYKCCGFVLPRNTNWQQAIPGTRTDLEGKTDEEKMAILEKMPACTMLYMRSHTMLYLGTENGVGYVVSDLGTVVDSDQTTASSIQSVVVTPLTAKRGTGVTWLSSLTGAVTFKIPVPVPETTTVAPTETTKVKPTEKPTVKPTVAPTAAPTLAPENIILSKEQDISLNIQEEEFILLFKEILEEQEQNLKEQDKILEMSANIQISFL